MPDSISALVPASTPLPDTSTRASSTVSPVAHGDQEVASERGAAGLLEHQPEPQSLGSGGSSLWLLSRSRSSSSIASPRSPCTPSFFLVRASTSASSAVTTMVAMSPGPARPISAS